jgi:hypothetical protein
MQSFSLSANALRAWRAYERQLQRRPVRTQMTTSAVLVSCQHHKINLKYHGAYCDPLVTFKWGLGDLIAQKAAERRTVIDERRVLLTAGFGTTFMGPVGHFWYMGL